MINREYAILIKKVLDSGHITDTRNSKVKKINTYSMSFTELPLISVRKTAWKTALREMEFFLSGSTNINDLHKSVRKWWEPWADEDGNIQNHYGKQLRRYTSYDSKESKLTVLDQINHMTMLLRNDPYSRRIVATAWDAGDMASEHTPLTTCHGTVMQFFSNPDGTLDYTMYQRSADIMVGLPHNLVQHWAFFMYMAGQCRKKVGKFTWVGGDCHIYESHLDAAEQVVKAPLKHDGLNFKYIINPEFKAEDFTLDGEYEPILDIKLPLIV